MQFRVDVLLERIMEFVLSWGGGGCCSAWAVYYSKQKSWHFMQHAQVSLSKLGLNCHFLTEFLFFFHSEYT